jgi:hypothetical protein
MTMVVDWLAQGLEVPPLSPARIAAEADAVLRDYADLVGAETLAPIEVEDIAVSLLKLSVGFDNLQDSFDDRVHGAIWFSRREIWIDEELNPSVNSELLHRFFFTLAHELGHWVLHRHLFLDKDGNPTLFGRDSEPDLIGRSFSRRPLIERQADEFAGCLLMPEWLLRPAWQLFTGDDGSLSDDEVRVRVGCIDPARSSFVDGMTDDGPDSVRLMREAFCEPLSQQFSVSCEAMRIELEKLGLLA